MSEWKEYKLGEVGEIITGKTPSLHNPEDWGNEFLFITPSDYCNYGKYAKDSIRKLSVSGLERLKKKVLPPKSILVTCIGSDMGKVVMNNVMCITNQQINAIVPYKEYDNDFVYYSLLNAYDTLRVLGGDGTAVPIVNKSDFENIVLKMPSLVEQKRIAGVLSSLDDKIDLLHRENATLEALAETLFRHYFIENPDSTWKEGKLGDYVIETIGGEWGTETSEGESNMPVRCLRGADVADLNDGIATRTPLRYIKPIKYEKIKPNNGDVILEISGGTDTCSTGRVAYINEGVKQLFDYPIVFSNFCRLLRVKEEYTYFVYCYFRHLHKQGEFFSLENGSSGIHNLNYKAALYDDLGWPVPTDEKLVIEFGEKVKPYFDKINTNKKQILTLSAQRDTMLPRLMSGEVKIG